MQCDKFEDHGEAVFPDPKTARSGGTRLWIFDNQVEHASRENGRSLVWIILTMLVLHDLSSIVEAVTPATSVVRL